MREMAVHWHSLPADFMTKEENISTYITAERKKITVSNPRDFMQSLGPVTCALIQCSS